MTCSVSWTTWKLMTAVCAASASATIAFAVSRFSGWAASTVYLRTCVSRKATPLIQLVTGNSATAERRVLPDALNHAKAPLRAPLARVRLEPETELLVQGRVVLARHCACIFNEGLV